MSIFANTTLRELGELLSGAESILLFSHINPDPDAIGSSTALCLALRQQGVRSFVVLDEPLPGYMRFLERDLEAGGSDGAEGSCSAAADGGSPLTLDQDIIPEPDISLCIDCSEDSRLLGREESYYRGKVTVAIDHHKVKECSRDYYYVDSGTAACSQIVYQLMKEMGWPLDHKIAERLYAGLDGDTGCFMHSNTTSEVFRMAADLMEYDVDINTINVNLYQSKELPEVLIEARVLQQMELIAGGRALIGKVTPEDLEKLLETLRQSGDRRHEEGDRGRDRRAAQAGRAEGARDHACQDRLRRTEDRQCQRRRRSHQGGGILILRSYRSGLRQAQSRDHRRDRTCPGSGR